MVVTYTGQSKKENSYYPLSFPPIIRNWEPLMPKEARMDCYYLCSMDGLQEQAFAQRTLCYFSLKWAALQLFSPEPWMVKRKHNLCNGNMRITYLNGEMSHPKVFFYPTYDTDDYNIHFAKERSDLNGVTIQSWNKRLSTSKQLVWRIHLLL